MGFREGCLKETGAYEGLFGSGNRAQIMISLQKSDHVRNRPDCGDFTKRVGGDEDVSRLESTSWLILALGFWEMKPLPVDSPFPSGGNRSSAFVQVSRYAFIL